MKKLVSIVLALAMVLAVATAFAGTITINRKTDATYTETTTYTYYQVLRAEIGTAGTVNASTGASTGGSAAYFVDNAALQTALVAAGAGDVFDITAVANTSPTRYNYVLKENKTIADILDVVTDSGVLAAAPVTGTFSRAANATSATSPDLAAGYYVIKSSLGSVIAAQTLNNVTINEKNDNTTLVKDVNEVVFEYGESPVYTLTIVIPNNPANKDLIVYDHMAAGLTLNPAITVTGTAAGHPITGLSFTEDAYTPSASRESGFNYYQATIAKEDVIANAGQTIVLTYSAQVNENAVIYDPQNNKAHLEYSDHSYATPEDQENVKTLGFKIKKVDGTNTETELTGAEFSLWTAATGGTKIPLIALAANSESDNRYRVAKPAEASAEGFESAVITAGHAQIEGLDNKAYYLQEDKAPAGYNKLTSRTSITPSTTGLVEHKIENNQGTQLPSTGGIGTTIFYIVGGLLLVGAAVILVARRKAHD